MAFLPSSIQIKSFSAFLSCFACGGKQTQDPPAELKVMLQAACGQGTHPTQPLPNAETEKAVPNIP